jgi:hypothetical protein
MSAGATFTVSGPINFSLAQRRDIALPISKSTFARSIQVQRLYTKTVIILLVLPEKGAGRW